MWFSPEIHFFFFLFFFTSDCFLHNVFIATCFFHDSFISHDSLPWCVFHMWFVLYDSFVFTCDSHDLFISLTDILTIHLFSHAILKSRLFWQTIRFFFHTWFACDSFVFFHLGFFFSCESFTIVGDSHSNNLAFYLFFLMVHF